MLHAIEFLFLVPASFTVAAIEVFGIFFWPDIFGALGLAIIVILMLQYIFSRIGSSLGLDEKSRIGSALGLYEKSPSMRKIAKLILVIIVVTSSSISIDFLSGGEEGRTGFF